MKRNHLKSDPTVAHKARECGWNMDPTGLPRTKCDTDMQSLAGVRVSYTSFSTSSCRQGSFFAAPSIQMVWMTTYMEVETFLVQ